MKYLELTMLANGKKVYINMRNVLNVFEGNNGNTVVVQSETENYTVSEPYSAVKEMIKSLND